MYHLDSDLSVYSDSCLVITMPISKLLMSLTYLYIISTLAYHIAFICNPQWSLVYLCFLLYSCIFIFHTVFFDMFCMHWFCNPSDLLNESKIQYNTKQYTTALLLSYNVYLLNCKSSWIFGTVFPTFNRMDTTVCWIKFFQASFCITLLNGNYANISRTISTLIIRELTTCEDLWSVICETCLHCDMPVRNTWWWDGWGLVGGGKYLLCWVLLLHSLACWWQVTRPGSVWSHHLC